MLENLIDSVRTDADDTSASIQAGVQSSKTGILIGLSLALIVGMAISFMISRSTSLMLHRISAALSDGAKFAAFCCQPGHRLQPDTSLKVLANRLRLWKRPVPRWKKWPP